MIRWLLQIMVMLSDIMIITACGILIFSMPKFGIFGAVVGIYLLFQTYRTWKEQGGFIAWKPASIKRYMRNAKKLGL